MPIKAENKARYPTNWPEIRERIRQRAQDKCERCNVSNYAWGYRDGDKFVRVSKSRIIDLVKQPGQWVKPPLNFGDQRIIEIVCTVAHLDHQPENCADDNLQFLCQCCHLAHDHEHHQQNAYRSRREGRAVDMFEEPT